MVRSMEMSNVIVGIGGRCVLRQGVFVVAWKMTAATTSYVSLLISNARDLGCKIPQT